MPIRTASTRTNDALSCPGSVRTSSPVGPHHQLAKGVARKPAKRRPGSLTWDCRKSEAKCAVQDTCTNPVLNPHDRTLLRVASLRCKSSRGDKATAHRTPHHSCSPTRHLSLHRPSSKFVLLHHPSHYFWFFNAVLVVRRLHANMHPRSWQDNYFEEDNSGEDYLQQNLGPETAREARPALATATPESSGVLGTLKSLDRRKAQVNSAVR